MKSSYWYILLIVAIIVGFIFVKNNMPENSSVSATASDAFAQCLTDAGAVFYGAYWCPHCQAQKKLLNNSKKIPYFECSTPNGQGQVPECIELEITGYPTWIFGDGSRVDGEMTLKDLGERTNCSLPEDV